MKNTKPALFFLTILWIMSFSHMALADSYSDAVNVFKSSGITKSFFNKSHGYAIFPTVGKGGIGIGGAYGEGRVYEKGKMTGTVSLAKLSIGFQLGGQAFSEIIFFRDKQAYNEFTSGNFEFDASASAVAITAGAQAKAGTEGATAGANVGGSRGEQADIGYTKGMAVFVHTKGGLMYEAAIGGQKFTFTPK
ncbi:MAG: lipid-binding SYLF domain-containing protein [Desulfobacula sp.]|jgi:lipid-binding SYLF domain-containing protein